MMKYSIKFSLSIQRKLRILLAGLKQILLIYINNMKRASGIHQFLQLNFTMVPTVTHIHMVLHSQLLRQILGFILLLSSYFSTLVYLLQITAQLNRKKKKYCL